MCGKGRRHYRTIAAADESALRDLIRAGLECRHKFEGVKEAWNVPETVTGAPIDPAAPFGEVASRGIDLAKLRVQIVEQRSFRGRFSSRTLHEVTRLQQAAKAVDPLA